MCEMVFNSLNVLFPIMPIEVNSLLIPNALCPSGAFNAIRINKTQINIYHNAVTLMTSY